MKRLRRDKHGVEGIPLQLLVGIAVLAIALPPAISALDSLQNSMAEDRVEQEVRALMLAARQVALGGEGGRRTITLDLDVNGLEKVSIGSNRIGASSFSTRYKMKWTQEISVVAHDPLFYLYGGNGSVELSKGRYEITLEASSVHDLTGDDIVDKGVLISRG